MPLQQLIHGDIFFLGLVTQRDVSTSAGFVAEKGPSSGRNRHLLAIDSVQKILGNQRSGYPYFYIAESDIRNY